MDMFSKGSFGTPFPLNTQRSPRQNSEPAGSSQGSPRTPARDTIFPNHAKESYTSGHKSQDPNHLPSQRNVTTPRRESFDQYRGMMNIPHSSSNCSDFGGTLSKDTYGSEQAIQGQSSTLAADHGEKSVETMKVKRKRPKFIRKVTCQVCGDIANDHMHYGAIACYSCRAFFRRGVKSNAPYFCSQSQSCTINKQSRKHCQYCRFQKCLSIGMKGNWVMTEEDKMEKKEKAIIRRRWNQIKKTKTNQTCTEQSYPKSNDKVPTASCSNIPQNMEPKHHPGIPYLLPYPAAVRRPDMVIKNDTNLGNEFSMTEESHPSILPSAAATARAVVSAAEHDHQLSQFPKVENVADFGRPSIPSPNDMDWYSGNDNTHINDGRESPPIDAWRSQGTSSYRNLPSPHSEHQYLQSKGVADVIKQEVDESMMSSCSNRSNDLQTNNELLHSNELFVSTDTMKEYHSDSSESTRSFSPMMDDYSPKPSKTHNNTFANNLLKNKGKLTFSSNLLNEPVMPFTREENALISNVINSEKETTQQMPISNDTLQAIMQAVQTGSSLSYKATLEGYTVCMKRIIKFATKIDFFREFCSQDQKNLLLSNTDMLVNIRSARMLRPGFNLQDQLSIVFGAKNGAADSSPKCDTSKPLKKRLEYKQVYSSPWASGEDEEQKFYAMMSTIFELQMDHTTTALIAMMALFSQVILCVIIQCNNEQNINNHQI